MCLYQGFQRKGKIVSRKFRISCKKKFFLRPFRFIFAFSHGKIFVFFSKFRLNLFRQKMRNFREIENAKISRKNYLYDILGKYEFMNSQDFIANIEISRAQNISWKHFYVHPLHIRKIYELQPSKTQKKKCYLYIYLFIYIYNTGSNIL